MIWVVDIYCIMHMQMQAHVLLLWLIYGDFLAGELAEPEFLLLCTRNRIANVYDHHCTMRILALHL